MYALCFFCLLKLLRPCLYGLWYPTQPHGEQLHTTWPPRMQLVPPFGVYKEKHGNFPNLVLALPSTLEI